MRRILPPRRNVGGRATRFRPDLGAVLRVDRVRSADGATLKLDPGTTDIVAADRNAAGADILLVRCLATDALGVLVAADGSGTAIGFALSRHRAPALACRVLRASGSGAVSLRHPVQPLHACAPPRDTGEIGRGAVPVTLDRLLVGGWELFTLDPVPLPSALAGAFAQAMATMFAALAGRVDLHGWVGRASASTWSIAGQGAILLASDERRDRLADALLDGRLPVDRFSSLWPDAIVTGLALHGLLEWTVLRPTRSEVPLSGTRDRDLADAARPDAVNAGDGQVLLSAIRGRIRPRRTLAILATARNEGIYLVDWLAHHHALGIEHVFLYTNDNTDGSDALLQALAPSGMLTVLPQRWDGITNVQRRAYNHALLRLPEILDFRWTAVIDVDEFLMVDDDRFDALPSLLEMAEAGGGQAIALNWIMHPPDGALRWSADPLIDRFPRVEPLPNPHVKTLFRSGLASGSTSHAPIWSPGRRRTTLDADGRFHHRSGLPFRDAEFRHADRAGPAWVAHFHLKSLEEFLWKAARARCSEPGASISIRPRADNPLLPSFAAAFHRTDLMPSTVSPGRRVRFAAERARLLALPGVASALSEATRRFRRGVDELVRTLHEEEARHPGRFPADFVDLIRRRNDLVAVEERGRGG